MLIGISLLIRSRRKRAPSSQRPNSTRREHNKPRCVQNSTRNGWKLQVNAVQVLPEWFLQKRSELHFRARRTRAARGTVLTDRANNSRTCSRDNSRADNRWTSSNSWRFRPCTRSSPISSTPCSLTTHTPSCGFNRLSSVLWWMIRKTRQISFRLALFNFLTFRKLCKIPKDLSKS